MENLRFYLQQIWFIVLYKLGFKEIRNFDAYDGYGWGTKGRVYYRFNPEKEVIFCTHLWTDSQDPDIINPVRCKKYEIKYR